MFLVGTRMVYGAGRGQRRNVITVTAPFLLFAFFPHPTVLTKRFSCQQRRRKLNPCMSAEHLGLKS